MTTLVYDDEPKPKLELDPPPQTWWDTAKSAGQTAVDFATAAGNAGTFGLDVRRDALSGWLAGDYPDYTTGVAEEQKKLAKQRERSPIASVAGDVAGAVALPGMGGARLAARLGGGLGARALGFGAEGAALGAAQGVGNTYTGKPLDYLSSAAFGGGLGGVLGAGMGSVFGPRGGMRTTAEVPTTPQLFAEKNANYLALENSPALYEANALARAATNAENVLRAQRFHPSDSPRSFRAIDEMRSPPTTEHLGVGAPVSPGDIEYIRKGLNRIDPVTGGTDKASAKDVKRVIDNFILNPPPGAVMPGTEKAAAEATALAERARANYGGYKRGQMFDSITENALTSAGSANSGLNVQNRLRQLVAGGLRQNPQGQSAFSKAQYGPDEIAALTRFARVPFGDASLRYVDRIMGGGGGLGAMAAGGVAGGAVDKYFRDDPTWGSIAGAGIPAAGLALRTMGNRRATANMAELSNMVRRRTPLYRERVAASPMVGPPGGGIPAGVRDAIALEILKQQNAE